MRAFSEEIWWKTLVGNVLNFATKAGWGYLAFVNLVLWITQSFLGTLHLAERNFMGKKWNCKWNIFSFWFTSRMIKALSRLNTLLTSHGRMSVAKKTQVS